MTTKQMKNDKAPTMAVGEDQVAETDLRAFPKIELHAHLNGSIREETLFELARERNIKLKDHFFNDNEKTTKTAKTANKGFDTPMVYGKRHRSLQECFSIFAEIGKVIVAMELVQL